MGKNMKACRVCGALYEACPASRKADGVFRWREVACSPECGAEYLRQVNEARGLSEEPKAEQVVVAEEPAPVEVEAAAEPAKPGKRNKRHKEVEVASTEPVEAEELDMDAE